MPELLCYFWDGQISLGRESRQRFRSRLNTTAQSTKLVEDGEVDGQAEVSGTHVRMELSGEPKHVEKFREPDR